MTSGVTPAAFAGQDLLAIEVAAVRDRHQFLNARRAKSSRARRSVARLNGPKPAAVDRDDRVGEQVQTAQIVTNYRQAARIAGPLALAKVRDRLEIQRRRSRQPHQSTLRAVSRLSCWLDSIW